MRIKRYLWLIIDVILLAIIYIELNPNNDFSRNTINYWRIIDRYGAILWQAHRQYRFWIEIRQCYVE